MTGNVLGRILVATRRRVSVQKEAEPEEVLARRIAAAPPPRHFSALFAGETALPAVIAEVKRASPSEGAYAMRHDPAATAGVYAAAGAAAVSVVTEPDFFAGSVAHLAAVRRAVGLPLLMKDFVVDPYQLSVARAYGADAVLLIAAALEDAALRRLIGQARGLGLSAFVEVHDAPQMERALAAGARLVGVNSRDLATLEVDLGRAFLLGQRYRRSGAALVCESGIRTRADLLAAGRAGFSGCLIGTSLMTADDPGSALAALVSPAGGEKEAVA